MGETLWIVQLWLFAAIFWAWKSMRLQDFNWQWSRIEWALAILVLSQTISSLHVVLGTGDRRSALNMLWEWIGLGVSFVVLRHTFQTFVALRSLLVSLSAVAVVLSGFGVWQHYVWYPQVQADYDALRTEFDELEKTGQNPGRRNEILREFASQGIPTDGRSRVLWEQRLKSSREPFGLFALANSFAGLLAVWLTILVGSLFAAVRTFKQSDNVSKSYLFLMAASALLVGFCLLLTKSRTAWVGSFCSLTCLVALQWLHGRSQQSLSEPNSTVDSDDNAPQKARQRWIVGGLVSAFVVITALTVAGLSGGLDREVLSEAPKSLAYRLEYWTASASVIMEQPWFGTGPGNFRSTYLHHKLPGSSEEVADPHNMFLDVWSNAGIGAFLGLVLLLSFGLIRAWKSGQEQARNATDETKKPVTNRLSMPVVFGVGFGLLMPMGYQWLLGYPADERLLALFVAWFLLMLAYGSLMPAKLLESQSMLPGTLLAALLAISVHLLGAGGIAMPAITQVILILLLACQTSTKSKTDVSTNSTVRGPLVATATMAFCVVLFLTCLMTATVPVINRTALIAAGDYQHMTNPDPSRSMQFYTMANTADPFSLKSLDRLAQLEFRAWKKSFSTGKARFARAIELAEIAQRQDPINALRCRELGQWYREHFEATKSQKSAVEAAKYFEMAVDRYPGSADLRVLAAETQSLTGNTNKATTHARIALDYDNLNRQAGHADRYLSDDDVRKMQLLLPPNGD